MDRDLKSVLAALYCFFANPPIDTTAITKLVGCLFAAYLAWYDAEKKDKDAKK